MFKKFWRDIIVYCLINEGTNRKGTKYLLLYILFVFIEHLYESKLPFDYIHQLLNLTTLFLLVMSVCINMHFLLLSQNDYTCSCKKRKKEKNASQVQKIIFGIKFLFIFRLNIFLPLSYYNMRNFLFCCWNNKNGSTQRELVFIEKEDPFVDGKEIKGGLIVQTMKGKYLYITPEGKSLTQMVFHIYFCTPFFERCKNFISLLQQMKHTGPWPN
ncbi:hypothetical protein RFI_03614 [Reticulomyxa filosa]|uniref:Uncharacterized protein n=1 Tax=Reticulomyxa filosa TaxID=46433 RepID=X6P4N0_RETFI|nr:hypothetical protein RFI_03614 [Reticulomyxa filosa]|eukprot:ETO33490.1 hypothetical protein RFI_03614 [Reticulomyxa filosa]